MTSLCARYVEMLRDIETRPMTYELPVSKRTASGVVGVAAILFYFWLLTWTAPASAMTRVLPQSAVIDSGLHQAKVYKRGRAPVYPYSAKGPGPNGWTSYFGFVPYTPGNIENEAIQRNQYPMRYWPHNANAPVPQPYSVSR